MSKPNNTDYKIIVCAAIRNAEKKIFIARRKADKKLGGFWEFPGGKLEHGEELEEALLREIDEELKIKVTVDKLLLIKPYLYDHAAVMIFFYECRYLSGDLKLIDHDRFKWCSATELETLDLLPANQEAILALKKIDSNP